MRYSVVYFAALVLATSEALACPGPCEWTDGKMNYVSSFSSFDEMAECKDGVVLFEFNDDDSVSACLFNGEHSSNVTTEISKPSTNAVVSSCGSGGYSFSDNMVLASWGTGTSGDAAKSITALLAIQSFMMTNCESTTSFAYNSPIVAAVWAGPLIRNDLFSRSALQVLISDIANNGIPINKAIQRCPASGVDGATTWGAVVNTVNQPGSAIKPSIDQWSRGKCLTGFTSSITVNSGSMWALADGTAKSGNRNPDGNLNQCRYFKATKNNMSCAEIAVATGVTEYMINFLNNGVCSTYIFAGQPVCYSSGAMPDFRPKPNADGSCVVHTIVSGQSCASLLKMYPPLTQADLMNYNKQTYGWYGCDGGHPWANDKICVSSGTPPRPTPNPEAECGPLAPGDKYNSECPLKACCSYAGFCGLAAEHCAIEDSPTGAPGTTGCFSNCDIKYVASGPPAEFINIGYYESWSIGWPCMNAGVLAVDWSSYSHVHFAFAGVDVNVNVVMDANATSEFEIFKSMSGFKKIISFGGWGISTDPSTYQYLRNAMIPGNVGNFVNRLVSFVNSNNLDGIDIDWEYPGAPDIPGIPPGLASDGPNYLIFLRKLRAALPADKSLSIAAPASYWYLKAFPITDMAVYLNYIVYMTYDLHGQWDYGNEWTGNYLRSHVNWTETKDTLALITHAGVPSNKLLLGMGAYGRSFKQSDPNCSGPMCTFTGPASGAIPGKCTNTAGYISLAELDEIVASGNYRSYGYDRASDSAVMTYGTDQWVSWTTEVTMGGRVNWAQANNMGGIVVWAADLMKEVSWEDIEEEEQEFSFDPSVCIEEANKYNNIDVVYASDEESNNYMSCAGIESPSGMCREYAAARSLSSMTGQALSEYDYMLANNYDKMFNDYYRPSLFNDFARKYYGVMFNNENVDVSFDAKRISYNTTMLRDLWIGDWELYIDYDGTTSVDCDLHAINPRWKDEDGFYKALSSKFGFEVNKDLFSFGQVVLTGVRSCPPGSACLCTKILNVWPWFPYPNVDKVVPDPMKVISNNITDYKDFFNIIDKSTQEWDEDPSYIIQGAYITTFSLINGVDSMFDAYNTGRKIKAATEIAKRRAILNLILGFIFLALSFLPGMGVVAAVGEFATSVALGDIDNPFDIIVGAAGVAGDIFSVIKQTGKFIRAADKISNLSKVTDLMKILKRNKLVEKRINKIEERRTCPIN